MHIYDHEKGMQFKNLPAIYAVELTKACDLACPMCLRTEHMTHAQPGLFSLDLLRKMIDRGDFVGTSYTELQMAGEPTIHPDLGKIINMLQRAGVRVGLSTHGHNMRKNKDPGITGAEDVAHNLLRLNALTISVDSTDPIVYARMRVPKQLHNLVANLEYFASHYRIAKDHGPVPYVELQLVRTPREPTSGDVTGLLEMIRAHNWGDVYNVRVTDDCFTEMTDLVQIGNYVQHKKEPCLNPFMSVNVSQDGHVVSCCYIFDHDPNSINYYGDLNVHTLDEIWNGANVYAMQTSHSTGKLANQCLKCYYKSPALIHHGILARLLRHERGIQW